MQGQRGIMGLPELLRHPEQHQTVLPRILLTQLRQGLLPALFRPALSCRCLRGRSLRWRHSCWLPCWCQPAAIWQRQPPCQAIYASRLHWQKPRWHRKGRQRQLTAQLLSGTARAVLALYVVPANIRGIKSKSCFFRSRGEASFHQTSCCSPASGNRSARTVAGRNSDASKLLASPLNSTAHKLTPRRAQTAALACPAFMASQQPPSR